MEWFQQYAKEIVSALLPLISWLMQRKWRAKNKLVWAVAHQFTYLLPERNASPPSGAAIANPAAAQKTFATSDSGRLFNVHTQAIVIQNDGTDPVTAVEIVFNWAPQNWNLWPPRQFEVRENDKDRRYSIIFDSLSSGEYVSIQQLVAEGNLPEVLNVRSKEQVGRLVRIRPTKVVPLGVQKFMQTMFFMGIGLTCYLLIILVKTLVLQTP